jgi:type III restriction enzyme
VYSFSESFERHFKGAPEADLQRLHGLPDAVVSADEAAKDGKGILKSFVGQPRWSLANWLALQEPILIVDEAHNTKTDKSFTALKRLNPSLILELTATPVASQTNVLYHVSAQELAAGGVCCCANPACARSRSFKRRGRWQWLCAAHGAVSSAERQ